MTMITIPKGTLDCYVAEPEPGKPAPGVVVIHDVLGMTNDLRAQADWLAGAGFLTAAPDLFGSRNKAMCMFAVLQQLRARRGDVFDAVESVRIWLLTQPGCTGTVGVIGFCLGGGVALALAPGRGFGAAAVNYGAAHKGAYTTPALRGACPVVGSFGAKDVSLRGAAAKLEASLSELGIAHDVKEYPDAGHGFMNDHEGAGDHVPAAMGVLATFTPAMGYLEDAALDARRRIVAFFNEHLSA